MLIVVNTLFMTTPGNAPP